ncbi:MAG: TolB family protein [Planctomycetota bacterium]
MPHLNRRTFLSVAAGTAGLPLLDPRFGLAQTRAINGTADYDFDAFFPRYTQFDPKVPIWCVTPGIDRVFHRFHSSCPFSPSGRYLALTRLPREDKTPEPGDLAEIVLIDLMTGKPRVVAETRGADTQLGAQAQWGADDSSLFFNDIDVKTWRPFGVKMDPATGKKKRLAGTVYMVSTDGKWAASPCLRRISYTQMGYGVLVPPEHIPVNRGAVDNDGLYVTNTETGEVRMIASFKRIVEEAVPSIDVAHYGPGGFYGFHVKWSPDGSRLMLVLRYMPDSDRKYRPQLITMKPDGSDIRVAIPNTEWADKGGNHPNWHPDSVHVFMNLKADGKNYQFFQARYDGSDLHIMTDAPGNGGHPTVHPSGKYILTDNYAKNDVFGDGTSPLLWVDLAAGTNVPIARVANTPSYIGSKKELRLDLHPAWDRRTWRYACFNGLRAGTRAVYVADLSGLLKEA